MDQGAATIVSAIIAGLFTLIGVTLEKKASVSPILPSSPGSGAQPTVTPIPSFSIGRSLIHIGVIQFIIQILGAIVGFITGIVLVSVPSMRFEDFMNIVILISLIAGSLGLIIAFTISGAKVDKMYRWQHLFYVALGIAISSVFVNYLIFAAIGWNVPFDTQSLAVAAVQTFVCMAIGGAIANITSS
jgi:hypothetical protein